MGTPFGPVATVASDAPFRCAADSHPGLVRSNNEDLYHFDRQRGIFLVVDGVGGEAGGEAAADAALRALRATLEEAPDGLPPDRIRRAIANANSDILRLARRKPELQGMACVLTVALVDGERLTVGHVGDSRLYKLRGGAISKLTRDHSPIGEREDRGELSEADAMSHPRRNEVYRDETGFRTGFRGTYTSHTIGLSHQFNDVFMVRPEIGYYRNWNQGAFDLGTRKDMLMGGLDVTMRF